MNGCIDRVNYYLKQIIHHLWKQISYEVIRNAKVWIGIDLYQPQSEVLVNQEVITKQLEAVLSPVWIELVLSSLKRVYYQIFHPWNEVLFDTEMVLWIILIKKALQYVETYGVTFLMNSVISAVLL
jgi:hypothetical protein